ncbi:RNA polymerase II-associated protein [Mycena floridula]|nr:RNA polymerase II-associated protein [Mycena floridula]
MSDALTSLRQAIKAHEPITYTKDDEPCSSLAAASHIVIPPALSFPKATPTRYRKAGGSSLDVYSLEALYLAWLLKNAPGAEYMKQARENGLNVGFVSVTERKGVVEWLEGKEDNSNIIPLVAESNTPPGSPTRKSSAPEPPASPTKRRYVADAQDVEVVKKIKLCEIELRDRNTVLRGTKSNNFSAIRNVYTDKLKKLKDASKPGAAPPTPTPTPDPKVLARKARHNYPIIMISSSPTALITMHNVRKFLQESSFEPSQIARARAMEEGNTKPEDMIPIYRKLTNIDPSGKETVIQAKYFIVDSVEALSKFGPDAWERVVCVMTTGQAWQFRPYKWNEPRVLFHHVKGIYISWSNDPPNTKIKDWNVTELKIDPNRRHVDKSVVAHFWKTLDTWTMSNKPWLMKS